MIPKKQYCVWISEKSLSWSISANIVTGVIADTSANPSKAADVATQAIIHRMDWYNVLYLTIPSRKYSRLKGHNGTKTGGDALVVNPQLLFHRLLIVAKSTTGCDHSHLFRYKLSRAANKTQLADTLISLVEWINQENKWRRLRITLLGISDTQAALEERRHAR